MKSSLCLKVTPLEKTGKNQWFFYKYSTKTPGKTENTPENTPKTPCFSPGKKPYFYSTFHIWPYMETLNLKKPWDSPIPQETVLLILDRLTHSLARNKLYEFADRLEEFTGDLEEYLVNSQLYFPPEPETRGAPGEAV